MHAEKSGGDVRKEQGGNSENSGRRLREAGVWFSLLLFKRPCKLAR